MSRRVGEPARWRLHARRGAVAVVIEAIIVGALGIAFVGILNGTTTVSQSLASRATPASRRPTS